MPEWPFTSHSQLVAAGWSFKNCSQCKYCLAEIEWWKSPSRGFLPLDPATFRPHGESCAVHPRLPQSDKFHFCAMLSCNAKVPPANHFCKKHWNALPWCFQGTLLDLKDRPLSDPARAMALKLSAEYLEHLEAQKEQQRA